MFADVIVDLSANAVDRTFTYAVPEEVHLERGFQVRVPFGPRRIEGFVLNLHKDCDLPSDKVKPVQSAVHDYAVLLPELIDLSEYMRTRYRCNLVDALRLMLPAQMRGERVKVSTRRMAKLLWTEEQVEAFANGNARAKAQIEILRRLEAGEIPTAELSASALKGLIAKGAVEIAMQEQRRTPHVLADERRSAEPELTHAQANAVREICAAVDEGGKSFLLHGVTGSGKTEVYIRVIRHVLSQGKTAMVLVPEIALTPQMVSWLHARFGAEAAVLHSRLSAGERYDEWRRIRFGQARVVIGARSAIFAPLQDVGAIIVDEEHESSYQSDRRPRYDAKEIARHRAEANGAALVLGSATPSIGTYLRCNPNVRRENRLTLVELRKRVLDRPLPTTEVVDMRSELAKGNHGIFSAKLSNALEECLEKGQQAVLFLNRRGYAPFVECRACGESIKCEFCDVTMTYHRTDGKLRCHYCGYEIEPPTLCPKCGSKYIKYMGLGTQRIEEEVLTHFPTARTVRIDVDTTQRKDSHETLLNRFASGKANVMIGTQMIAKGLDFPKVTLVGVVMADMTLRLPDYRSPERTFQLITQVAGRAGRAEMPGRVIVQTYDPEHYAIELAVRQDYRAFFEREIAYRKKALYPPYTAIARIVFSSDDREQAQKAAAEAEIQMNAWIDQNDMRRMVLQARSDEAPINRLRGKWRYQLFFKMLYKGDVDRAMGEMQRIADVLHTEAETELEINPTNMM